MKHRIVGINNMIDLFKKITMDLLTTNSKLFSEFLGFLDIRETTVITYTKCIKKFFNWATINLISNPNRADVLRYRNYLKENCKPSIVQIYILSLKQYYKWLEAEGICKDITRNIKGSKIDKAFKKDYFTVSQIKRILSIDKLSKRDKAIICLAVIGGLRTIEISRAIIEDIRNLGDKTVLYIQGKGKDEKTEYVELPQKLEEILRLYLKDRANISPKAPLFTSESNRNMEGKLTTKSISRLIKNAFIQSGYNNERLTAHSLRHTTATLSLLHGSSLEETQEYLRHSNINSTVIYSHHMNRKKNQTAERLANLIFE